MHPCPECGQSCDCNGDVDDTLFDDDSDEVCEHICGADDDEIDDLGMPGFEDDGRPRCFPKRTEKSFEVGKALTDLYDAEWRKRGFERSP